MTDIQLLRRLTKNAIDFLTKAIEDFRTQPKYSIINFYTAVELFLKARLMHEHWSLIVLKNADRKKFEAGDFISVSFEEACERLDKVVQSPVSDNARRNFNVVRKHRNRMVHFFHDDDQAVGVNISAIAREQLHAWYHLHQLLTVQWARVFQAYRNQFDEIERKLADHKEYLRAKFEEIEPEIVKQKALGHNFEVCDTCDFDAAHIESILGALHKSDCLVCGFQDKWFDYSCPNCEVVSRLYEGGEFTCPNCAHGIAQGVIADEINQFVATKDNYFEAMVPANCVECDCYQSVVEYEDQYLCVVCFRLTSELECCGWCSEFSNGDMEDSHFKGCGVCEGSAGWNRDKDD